MNFFERQAQARRQSGRLVLLFGLAGSRTSPVQRRLIGWFGIRGIGSLYYLSYALSHGLDPAAVDDSIGLTLSVVALSILLHGISTQPILARYEQRKKRKT
mgnify:CR=1 FL=1